MPTKDLRSGFVGSQYLYSGNFVFKSNLFSLYDDREIWYFSSVGQYKFQYSVSKSKTNMISSVAKFYDKNAWRVSNSKTKVTGCPILV
jgi:hypothetical protein